MKTKSILRINPGLKILPFFKQVKKALKTQHQLYVSNIYISARGCVSHQALNTTDESSHLRLCSSVHIKRITTYGKKKL